jgi:hypothetical protein
VYRIPFVVRVECDLAGIVATGCAIEIVMMPCALVARKGLGHKHRRKNVPEVLCRTPLYLHFVWHSRFTGCSVAPSKKRPIRKVAS